MTGYTIDDLEIGQKSTFTKSITESNWFLTLSNIEC